MRVGSIPTSATAACPFCLRGPENPDGDLNILLWRNLAYSGSIFLAIYVGRGRFIPRGSEIQKTGAAICRYVIADVKSAKTWRLFYYE